MFILLYYSALYKVMAVFAYQRSWIISGHSHFLLLRFLSLFSKNGKGVISESVSNKIDNSLRVDIVATKLKDR